MATYFLNSNLELQSTADILTPRLGGAAANVNLKPGKASLFHPVDKQYLPHSDKGRLRFGGRYKPYPLSEEFIFYLPTYKVRTTQVGPLTLPEIKFEWLAPASGVLNEGDALAQLVVKLEQQKRTDKSISNFRIINHDISLDYTYSAVDQNGKLLHRIDVPFDSVVKEANGNVYASLTINSMDMLSQIVRSMEQGNTKPHFNLHATAEMYVPGASYMLDLAAINNIRFQETLWNSGWIANNVIKNETLKEKSAEPFKIRNRKLILSQIAGRVSSSRPVPTHVMVTPVAAPAIFTVQPRLSPAAIAAISATNVRATPLIMHSVKLPTSFRLVSGLKTATINEQGQKRKDVKSQFKSSALSVNNRKAITSVVLTAGSGANKAVSIKKELQANMAVNAAYLKSNFGQIYEQIPQHIKNDIAGIEDPTLLIAFNINVGTTQHVVYQDPLQRNLFYYLPERFKLGRADNIPYEPLMRVGFKELLLEGVQNPDEVELSYRAEVSFTALPYLDNAFYSAAQNNSALYKAANKQSIVLSPLNPDGMILQIDGNSHGGIVESSVSTQTGVNITLDMDAAEFDGLFANLINDAGVAALNGRVKTPTESMGISDLPLSVSLYDTVGPVFSQQWVREDADPAGTYRVTVRNQTESTVRVASAKAFVSADGVMVTASISDSQSFTATPGESHELNVNVQPANAVVQDIEIDTVNDFDLDVDALWRLIMVNHGISSYAFTINVNAELPELFGTSPAAGVPPLTALNVEFQQGPNITLSTDQTEVEATLYKSLLADLMDQPLTETYTYRVTNIHGNEEWARGNWIESTGPLHVMPVVPTESD